MAAAALNRCCRGSGKPGGPICGNAHMLGSSSCGNTALLALLRDTSLGGPRHLQIPLSHLHSRRGFVVLLLCFSLEDGVSGGSRSCLVLKQLIRLGSANGAQAAPLHQRRSHLMSLPAAPASSSHHTCPAAELHCLIVFIKCRRLPASRRQAAGRPAGRRADQRAARATARPLSILHASSAPPPPSQLNLPWSLQGARPTSSSASAQPPPAEN